MSSPNKQTLLYQRKIQDLVSKHSLTISEDILDTTDIHKLKCEYRKLKKIIEEDDEKLDAEIFGLLLLFTFLS